MNNRGYIFQNYFDAACYLMISIIYPLLTYCIQINQMELDMEITSKLNLLVTGLFFSATYFYDYYQRFRDCEEQTPTVVNLLFIGRLGFCIFSVVSFFFLIIMACGFFPSIHTVVMSLFKNLPIFSFYPFITALAEIGKRMYYERKGKISRVSV